MTTVLPFERSDRPRSRLALPSLPDEPQQVLSPRAAHAYAPSKRPVPIVPRTSVVPLKGAVFPGRFSACPSSFARFEYMSEYGPEEIPGAASRNASSLSVPGASAEPFKVAHVAIPPKAAGAFARFRYEPEPYDAAEKQRKRELKQKEDGIRDGAFVAGGNARNGMGRTSMRTVELQAQLQAQLAHDWPSAFLRVTEDASGYMLCVFAAAALVEEAPAAELKAYMDRQLKMVRGLHRDLSRWGAAIDDVVVYSVRPLWVTRDPLAEYRARQTQQKSPRGTPR